MVSAFKNRFACMQKFAGAILCIVFLVASGCGKSNSSPECDEGEEIITAPEEQVNANVENASIFIDVVAVKLMMYDRCINRYIELARSDWKDDGFTILFPQTFNSNYLYTLIGGLPTTTSDVLLNISDVPPTMTISNKNVKVGHLEFEGVDKDDNTVNRFYLGKIDGTSDGIIYYTYVDSYVNISGYRKFLVTGHSGVDDDPHLYKWEKRTNYLIEWKKGLNAWRLTRSSNFEERIIIENWVTVPISSLKWYGNIYHYL